MPRDARRKRRAGISRRAKRASRAAARVRQYFPPVAELEAAPELTAKQLKSRKSTYSVTVTGGGRPLVDIKVVFYLRNRRGAIWKVIKHTDRKGQARRRIPKGYPVAFVRPVPYAGFWSMLAEAPPSGSVIDCTPLTPAGADGRGWWHRVMGVDVRAARRGKGIRVGIIDTGCGPHRNLRHVTLVGVFDRGRWHSRAAATDRDPQGHGTHTTGIIGARPSRPGDFAGLAPDCKLFHARGFEHKEADLDPTNVAQAIRVLSREYACDLINMSLGGGPPSKLEKAAIRYALERGTLCICSAGNADGERKIDYPAAFADCVAVSSIGQGGRAPAGTWAADQRPGRRGLMGRSGLFLSATSKFGAKLDCAGPGVGIVSTVRDRPATRRRPSAKHLYMEMDGASMASAAVCGTLAVILSNNAAYKALPRDRSRAQAARDLLFEHCRPLGLKRKYRGHGLPHV